MGTHRQREEKGSGKWDLSACGNVVSRGEEAER
ncbi:hypothetical protein E2C01_064913 [Portunus trituberculatus]|uniref:Uncharacterized protein n=1 Tax=Portunus trituberculatus TaxID=210409 RepID=A0A5B7HPP5_PORTR|nr:hypothetical protein [Portunus trituberculatus]